MQMLAWDANDSSYQSNGYQCLAKPKTISGRGQMTDSSVILREISWSAVFMSSVRAMYVSRFVNCSDYYLHSRVLLNRCNYPYFKAMVCRWLCRCCEWIHFQNNHRYEYNSWKNCVKEKKNISFLLYKTSRRWNCVLRRNPESMAITTMVKPIKLKAFLSRWKTAKAPRSLNTLELHINISFMCK